MILELFKSQGSGFSFTGITLRPSQILVTKTFFEFMGRPGYLKFYFDKEANAVGITVEKDKGDYIYATVLHKNTSVTVNCVLGKIMTKARYVYRKQDENGMYILTL